MPHLEEVTFDSAKSASLRAWILFAAACALVPACRLVGPPASHRRAAPELMDRKFSAAEIRADLMALLSALEDVHPDPYCVISKEEFQRELEVVAAACGNSTTRLEFYRHSSQWVAKLGDGHTSVGFPQEEFNRYLAAGGLLPSFDLIHRDDGVLVQHVFGDSMVIEPGDRVLSWNGQPIEAYLEKFSRLVSGPPAMRRTHVATNFRAFAWLDGASAPRGATFARGGFEGPVYISDAGVKTKTPPREQLQPQGLSEEAWQPYIYRRLADSVAYLDFRSMRYLPLFQQFLREIFEDMRRAPPRGLIVDLRRNGGGDSLLGEELLSYLSDRPYRMASRKEWRVSSRYRAFMKSRLHAAIRWLPVQYLHPVGRRMWRTPIGQDVVFESAATAPSPAARFTGPVAFLIGPKTYSSALMLANAVGDYGLATLIGEETAESPNCFGEVYWFDLPNTGLNVSISSARFVRANGDALDRRGVVPDIEVKASAADLKAGHDVVLARAREWVLAQPRVPPLQ
jgi:hypothetical protein